MRLFFAELQKILRPVPLLIVGAFTAVFAYVFMSIPYQWLTEVHMPCDARDVAADLIELGGLSPSPEEREIFLEELKARYYRQIEESIAADPRFASAGIDSYEDMLALGVKYGFSFIDPEKTLPEDWPEGYDPRLDYTLTPEEILVYEKNWMGEMIGSANLRYEHVVHLQERLSPEIWEQNEYILRDYFTTGNAAERFQEIYTGDERNSIQPYDLNSRLYDLFRFLGIMVLVSVLVLTAMLPAHDTVSGVRLLQYSSRKGRKINAAQLAACLCAAALIAATQTFVTLAVFAFGPLKPFLNAGIHSFVNQSFLLFFSGTLWQYLVSCGLLIVGIALAATLAAYLISARSRHYISLLLILVPCAAFFAALVLAYGGSFALSGTIFRLTGIPFAEIYILVLLLAVASALAIWTVRHFKRADIV